MQQLPVVDIAPFFGDDDAGKLLAAAGIRSACQNAGFFYLIGHGISQTVFDELEELSREFFALPLTEKMDISMDKAGRAWRGYFPVGNELTSGKPDIKEGLYFGIEHDPSNSQVLAQVPLYGGNLWPMTPKSFRSKVEAYLQLASAAAVKVLQGISLALDLEEDYFSHHYIKNDPTLLFRIFHYPREHTLRTAESWGVGEHTDYGLLTLLAQDSCGGLQVKTPDGWIEAPPMPGALICNIGDMLDRLTGGYFKSTPHRVRNVSHRDRLSWPLFFDPCFTAIMQPLPTVAHLGPNHHASQERWDGANLDAFEGTYGQYLMQKVAKVFPDLGAQVNVV